MTTQHLPIDRLPAGKEPESANLSRVRENFVNTMSHEIRTPLTSIIGYADLLMNEDRLSPEERKEFAQIIRDEGRRLASLVNDCLDVSHLEQGETSLQLEEVDMVAFLREIVDHFQQDALRKSLTVATLIHSDRLMTKIDAGRLRRAIENVVHNAVKYSPEQGRVFLKLRKVAGFIELQVWDEGPGIPIEQLPYLFNVFSQHNHPEQGIRGTGLGLAIARYLIEIHGGSIGVRSKPNQGSTFIIRFPQL